MRNILIGFTCVALLSVAVPAQAKTTCTVTPNPVSLSGDLSYTVTATGGTPAEYYEVVVQQPRHHWPDEGRDWLGQADASGTVVAEISVDTSGVFSTSLFVGNANVSVVRYRTGGGPGGGASQLATCNFTVVG